MSTRQKICLLLTLSIAVGTATAAPVDGLLGEYGASGAGPFTEAAGASLWTKEYPGSDGRRSCSTCHTPDPRKPGRHAVTSKSIEPLAPSANPKRLTDRGEIEKWLRRNCKWTLGRECTGQEKGDLLTFLKAQ
jgi:hypothetical protein